MQMKVQNRSITKNHGRLLSIFLFDGECLKQYFIFNQGIKLN
jgi:hypothetical protein